MKGTRLNPNGSNVRVLEIWTLRKRQCWPEQGLVFLPLIVAEGCTLVECESTCGLGEPSKHGRPGHQVSCRAADDHLRMEPETRVEYPH